MFSAAVRGILACLSLCVAPVLVKADGAKSGKTPEQDPSTYMHVIFINPETHS